MSEHESESEFALGSPGHFDLNGQGTHSNNLRVTPIKNDNRRKLGSKVKKGHTQYAKLTSTAASASY